VYEGFEFKYLSNIFSKFCIHLYETCDGQSFNVLFLYFKYFKVFKYFVMMDVNISNIQMLTAFWMHKL
jgi:hypothetical protein